jgi:hypothetical protein
MKYYKLITTTTPEGVTYGYGADGLLHSIYIPESVPPKSVEGVHLTSILHKDKFELWKDEMLKENKLETVEESDDDHVPFDDFWVKYDDCIRSSRKRAMAKWAKMSISQRKKAYNFIDRYNKSRGFAEKKYAETYLNSEVWNN